MNSGSCCRYGMGDSEFPESSLQERFFGLGDPVGTGTVGIKREIEIPFVETLAGVADVVVDVAVGPGAAAVVAGVVAPAAGQVVGPAPVGIHQRADEK